MRACPCNSTDIRPLGLACNYCGSKDCPFCSTCCSERMMVAKSDELDEYEQAERNGGQVSSRNQRRLKAKRDKKKGRRATSPV